MSVYRIMLKDHNVMYAPCEPVPYITYREQNIYLVRYTIHLSDFYDAHCL